MQDENHSPSNCPSACFSGYDDLVNARAMLELVRDVPSFEAELGKVNSMFQVLLVVYAGSGRPTLIHFFVEMGSCLPVLVRAVFGFAGSLLEYPGEGHLP